MCTVRGLTHCTVSPNVLYHCISLQVVDSDMEEDGNAAADSEPAQPDELHDELPALDVQKATPNDLEEAAKQLIMGMVPKVGRFHVDRLLQVVLHQN